MIIENLLKTWLKPYEHIENTKFFKNLIPPSPKRKKPFIVTGSWLWVGFEINKQVILNEKNIIAKATC
jgi:hypothetical protein